MHRVNTVLEDGELPLSVKNELDLTWAELVEEGAEALAMQEDVGLEEVAE